MRVIFLKLLHSRARPGVLQRPIPDANMIGFVITHSQTHTLAHIDKYTQRSIIPEVLVRHTPDEQTPLGKKNRKGPNGRKERLKCTHALYNTERHRHNTHPQQARNSSSVSMPSPFKSMVAKKWSMACTFEEVKPIYTCTHVR